MCAVAISKQLKMSSHSWWKYSALLFLVAERIMKFGSISLVPMPVMDDGWQGKLARASVGPLVFIEDKDFLWHATTKRHGIHLAAASSWIRTQPRSIFPASRSRVWIQQLHFVFKILRGFVLHQKVLLILVCTGQRATCLYWYSFVNSCLEFFFRGRY